ncbi:hypothetical protein [Haloferax massiliensis]|uniref:Uncharacterized protein n=1 Tax=Haloferax massiliensis TaxID=1476858 RepID=A0A0D6JXU2_9EURY|nr:hypothetical protein BN996_03898 [Haloferax massiliensis]
MISQEPVRDWERQVHGFLTDELPDDVRADGERIVADVLAATVAGAAAPATVAASTSATIRSPSARTSSGSSSVRKPCTCRSQSRTGSCEIMV